MGVMPLVSSQGMLKSTAVLGIAKDAVFTHAKGTWKTEVYFPSLSSREQEKIILFFQQDAKHHLLFS